MILRPGGDHNPNEKESKEQQRKFKRIDVSKRFTEAKKKIELLNNVNQAINEQANNGSIREGSQASALSYSTGIIGRIFKGQLNSNSPKGFALMILLV